MPQLGCYAGGSKKKGLVDKEIANVALDRRKTKDLEKLNAWVAVYNVKPG